MKIKEKAFLRKAIKVAGVTLRVYIYRDGGWVVNESMPGVHVIYDCLVSRIYDTRKPGQTIDKKITEIFREVEGR